MSFEQIFKYFLSENKIRLSTWEKGEYIYLKNNQCYNQDGDEIEYVFTVEQTLSNNWELVENEYFRFFHIMHDLLVEGKIYTNVDDKYNEWITYNRDYKCFLNDSGNEVLLSAQNIYEDRWIERKIISDENKWKTLRQVK